MGEPEIAATRADESGQCPYSPTDSAVVENPFPAYEQLREQCPVHRTTMAGIDFLTVARRDDVHAILTSPNLWVNRHGAGIAYSGEDGRGNLQHYDQPEHTKRRVLMRNEFNPLEVRKLADSTRALAEGLADDMEAAGPDVELHDDFACPLPILGFIDLMGVDPADRHLIKSWADQLVLGLSDPKQAVKPTAEIKAYINGAVSERRRVADSGGTPRPGLLTEYSLRLLDGERIPLIEMESMVLQLLVAGHETTTSLITNFMWRMLEDTSRWDRIVADHSLIPNAIEESLRFDPPVLGLFRTNVEETSIRDVPVPAKSKVMALYASANRDPDAFPNPDHFDIDRDEMQLKRHYSFGWGIHHCLGAPLARQTARIAIETLASRFPAMRANGATERLAPEILWGRRKLPVRLR
ncbi:MAG: cytochrome P450 [Acidobacteria bacterium]|nr:cytochrome P450 [Acidobacteriota bacterium]